MRPLATEEVPKTASTVSRQRIKPLELINLHSSSPCVIFLSRKIEAQLSECACCKIPRNSLRQRTVRTGLSDKLRCLGRVQRPCQNRARRGVSTIDAEIRSLSALLTDGVASPFFGRNFIFRVPSSARNSKSVRGRAVATASTQALSGNVLGNPDCTPIRVKTRACSSLYAAQVAQFQVNT